MRVIVHGRVLEVENREFTDKSGEIKTTFDAWLQPGSPRFGPDRISGPVELRPKVGDVATYLASVTARSGRNGAWLSVWCVERAQPPAPATAGA